MARTWVALTVVIAACGEPAPPREPRPDAPAPTASSAVAPAPSAPAPAEPKRVVPFSWRPGVEGAMATLVGAGEEFFATVTPDNDPRLSYVTSPVGNTASPRLVLPGSAPRPELVKLAEAVQACFRRALEKDAALTGSLHLLVRASFGVPVEASASGDEALAVLGPCLGAAAAGIIYPEDGEAWLAFPLMFTP
jgi:hypothetical protein